MLEALKKMLLQLDSPVVTLPMSTGLQGFTTSVFSSPEDAVLFVDFTGDPTDPISGVQILKASQQPFVARLQKGVNVASLGGGNIFTIKGDAGVFITSEPLLVDAEISRFVAPNEKTHVLKRAVPLDKFGHKRLVTGVAMEPDTIDAHDELYSPDECEANMIDFAVNKGRIGFQHMLDITEKATVVESWIVRDDNFFHAGKAVKKGSWMLTFKVHDDQLWEEILTGKVGGISIGGYTVPDEHEVQNG